MHFSRYVTSTRSFCLDVQHSLKVNSLSLWYMCREIRNSDAMLPFNAKYYTTDSREMTQQYLRLRSISSMSRIRIARIVRLNLDLPAIIWRKSQITQLSLSMVRVQRIPRNGDTAWWLPSSTCILERTLDTDLQVCPGQSVWGRENKIGSSASRCIVELIW